MKNKGAAGVDDMPITALKAHLALHKEKTFTKESAIQELVGNFSDEDMQPSWIPTQVAFILRCSLCRRPNVYKNG